MKKAIITAIAFMVVSSTAMASGQDDTVRYLSTKFWQNWFISADGSANWWQGSDKNPAGNYTAVQWDKPSFGGSINVGKYFNHWFALRLAYDVNPGKSYIDGLHVDRPFINFLFDGTFNYDENYANNGVYTYEGSAPDENGYYNTSFMYHNLHVDAMVNVIDLFKGYYNPYRIYTPVIYAGMGVAVVSEKVLITPDVINNIKNKGGSDFDLKGVNFEYCFNAGLMNNFRISDHFDLNLDIKLALPRWNIDTWFYEPGNQQGGWVYPDGTTASGNVANANGEMPVYYGRHRMDKNYSVSLGVTYFFSRIYDLPNNCCEEMDELRRRLAEFENMPEPTPEIVHDTVVKFVDMQTEDIVSYPFSIFFHRDSYQLMSGRDLVNLREIAEVAKANGYKLRLRGSCDSATATPAYNQTLSENRCRKIMMELMEMGIPESQMILVPMGGVKELDPTEYDRRVLVELIKEAPKH